MALLPGYEYDIFISYRHNDNRSGWVTDFVKALQEELAATIKDPVSVYFDVNPHDGLLESHNVDKSLENKLRCLIFIPIISQTYCDPKSFAWQHEFCVFNKMAREDSFGMDIKLSNGNVASRILPIKIHDLDAEDKAVVENEIHAVLRAIEFIFKSPGVNRPLIVSDPREENINKTLYRDQINKVANAIKLILSGLTHPANTAAGATQEHRLKTSSARPLKSTVGYIIGALILVLLAGLFIYKSAVSPTNESDIDKSIAVLPFVDLSEMHDQEHFGDGIADEIINSLSQIQDLKVPGRASTFWFKNKPIDIKEVGDRLKVTTVLQGSVRKQGAKVKITVQLTNVSDGFNVWSEIFERSLNDVFAIEEEIANKVINKLKVTVLQNEKIEIAEDMTLNPEAYDAFLKGRFFWNNRELNESEKYFKQAIALDSSFAMAYAGLAETYVVSPFFFFESPQEAMPKAQQAAEKAIQLNSSLTIPNMVLAFKNTVFDWNPQKAKMYFEKSIQLNPNYAPAHYWYGQYYCYYTSEVGEAVNQMKRAVELEPMGMIPHFNLGVALIHAHEYELARKALLTSVELSRQNHYGELFLGNACALTGRDIEAREAYQRSSNLGNDLAAAFLIHILMRDNNVEEARTMCQKLLVRSETKYVSNYSLALAHHFLGDKEKAHTFFRQAFEVHDVRLIAMVRHPLTDYSALLTDPRNLKLVEEYFSGKVDIEPLKKRIF